MLKVTCQAADYVSINSLEAFQGNLKELPQNQLDKLKKSLKKHGFSFPVFVWKNGSNKIIDGHQRVHAARQMLNGEDLQVPVAWIEAKNEKEAKEKVLLATSQYGRLQREGFEDFIEAAELELDELCEIVDFPEIDIEALADKPMPGLTDDDEVPTHTESRVHTGELWMLGDHKLLCGDATKKEDVDRLMAGEKADMVFTDPPYGVSYTEKNEYLNSIGKPMSAPNAIENDSNTASEMFDLWLNVFTLIGENLADKSSYYICSPQGGELMMMMQAIDQSPLSLKHTLIWNKNEHVLGRCDYHYKHEPILYGWLKKGTHLFYGKGEHTKSVWDIEKPHNSDLHPTMKPVELMQNALLNSSDAGNVALDLFGGSGSTLIACEKLNRKCFMMEIDETYCSVILERWENFTGKKAVKEAKRG